eukprot:Phypoly_transcript_12349.p1 GENE.Phypoly_transcript_12349~~Phypoly_transcript_12349.p1  ORF type:complete len:362 (+),score=36.24 Phypoly_transcript_12349:137-1087(+)
MDTAAYWQRANPIHRSTVREQFTTLANRKDNKASRAAAPLAVDNRGFKTPKEVIAALIIKGNSKLEMQIRKLIVLALIGGIYNGLGGLCAMVALTGMPGLNAEFPAIPKFISACLWPIGLTFVVVCGAELYNGNCMTCTIAWCHAITVKKNHRQYSKILLLNLFIVLIANSIGAVGASYFFGYLSEIFAHEPYLSGIRTVAVSKTSYGWGAAFLRGIACNQVVCLGVFMATAAEDVISKILSCYVTIFTFVFSGYDGSISNMVIVPLSLMYGAPVSTGDFIWRSFIPAALGNLVGGFFLVSGMYYWAYYFKKEKAA